MIGGETAEMPDLYKKGEYDLSGTIVGIMEKKRILDGGRIKKGNVLIGVGSSGLHTNGYSLARKVLLNEFRVDTYSGDLGNTIGEELLKVHICYLDLIQNVISSTGVAGIAHITGGGIEGNTRRLLHGDLELAINWSAWERPAIFNLIQRSGNVPEEDMRRTFNLGVGLVFILPETDVEKLNALIDEHGFPSFNIGDVK